MKVHQKVFWLVLGIVVAGEATMMSASECTSRLGASLEPKAQVGLSGSENNSRKLTCFDSVRKQTWGLSYAPRHPERPPHYNFLVRSKSDTPVKVPAGATIVLMSNGRSWSTRLLCDALEDGNVGGYIRLRIRGGKTVLIAKLLTFDTAELMLRTPSGNALGGSW